MHGSVEKKGKNKKFSSQNEWIKKDLNCWKIENIKMIKIWWGFYKKIYEKC